MEGKKPDIGPEVIALADEEIVRIVRTTDVRNKACFMQVVSVGVGLPEGADRGRGGFVTILHSIL